MKTFKTFINEAASLWNYMYKKYNGTFYRGMSSKGHGVGLGALGMGVYVTWTESMAKTFAKHHGVGGEVKRFKVKHGLRMVDVQDQDFADVKEIMGFEPWEYSDTLGYASALTKGLQRLKYDGVISDKEVEGILIFNKKNVTEVK